MEDLMFDNIPNVTTMDNRVFMAKVFSEPCPLCKEMLGIDVTHSSETWKEIER